MTERRIAPEHTTFEHSIPWFWPLSAAMEFAEEGLEFYRRNVAYLDRAAELTVPPPPRWATRNRVTLDLDTMRLRDFSPTPERTAVPVLVDAPYAGHRATIADFAKGQSLVETLLAAGLPRVLVTDWKSATEQMKYFDIDKYLAEINAVVDDLGGRVHLVGLCQGGWMSAMFAARFPGKVRSLVLAGAPIDTHAGKGPLKEIARKLPLSFFEELVAAGNGRMLGTLMVAGWKNLHPEEHYFERYVDLYRHLEDRDFIRRTERFERWYENPVDLPGTFYLQAIDELFKKNRLARGRFVALGRRITLRDIRVPLFLLAGAADEITPKEQVFRAAELVGTPAERIERRLVPGGHIGLFMGRRTLREAWPEVGRWIATIGDG